MRRDLLVCALLASATVATYAGVRHAGFLLYDDPAYVTSNELTSAGLSAAGLRAAFTSFQVANWHPLTWVSHMLDVELFGLEPGPHHAVSVALHTANALLVYALVRGAAAGPGTAGFAAGLFALHPLHVESVAWIAERKDVLSTTFWLLALLAWTRYGQAPRVRDYVAALLAGLAALLSKPMAVTLPLTLLLLDFWPLARTRRVRASALLLEKLPLLLAAGAVSLLTLRAQQTGGALQDAELYPLALRLQTALVASGAYLGKALWPAGLTAFYPHPRSFATWQWLAAAALIAALSALALGQRRRRPWLLFGWLWYLVTLAPVSGVVQVGAQALADRYAYVPLIGPFVALAFAGRELAALRPRLRPAVAAAALAALALCALASAQQVSFWRDTRTLFEHTRSVTHGNYVAEFMLGRAFEADGRLDDAMARYRAALVIAPGYADARYNLGRLLAGAGRDEEARAELEASARLRPTHAKTRFYLGLLAERRGDPAAAAAYYAEGLRFDPDDAQARERLAVVRRAAGLP